jgi:hypothetical protein
MDNSCTGSSFLLIKKMIISSDFSGTLFEINNPAGNCPEHGYGLLGFMKIPVLGINPIIILRDHFVHHPDSNGSAVNVRPKGKSLTII